MPIVRFLVVLVALWAVASPADAARRRAFVTSVAGSGDLGSWSDAGAAVGLAAGDAICRARAAAAGFPNAGNYRAWLSTGATDAWCHLQGQTGKKGNCVGAAEPAGPWYLFNGITSFAGSLTALAGDDHALYRPVAFDEFGTEVPSDTRYWTGTSASGVSYSFGNYTCVGWTSAAAQEEGLGGRALATAGWWTDLGRRDCNLSQRLLCLEPGASETVTLGWSPGSLVFVTSSTGAADLGSWPEAGGATGLAAGDAICRTLAAAAHLPAPDSFVAWLSDANADARDRVTSSGPFRRRDAFTIASSRSDLLDGTITTSIHVDETGDYLAAGRSVWTGTSGAGLEYFSCGAWDTTEGSGGAGNAALSRSDDWTVMSNLGCSVSGSLYCFSNVTTLFWDGFEATGDFSRWSTAVAAP